MDRVAHWPAVKMARRSNRFVGHANEGVKTFSVLAVSVSLLNASLEKTNAVMRTAAVSVTNVLPWQPSIAHPYTAFPDVL